MSFPFEFIVEGRPVSQQTRRRERIRKWKEDVRVAALRTWPTGELPETGNIMLTITLLYVDIHGDVDNIPKPIADALKGLVYDDDEQITDILCRKRCLRDVHFRRITPALAQGLISNGDFLHITVDHAPNQQEFLL
ncbi:MAG: RusA family crossover junction endodeoxyribonuclease [Candidatus Kapaibacterium sp.]